MGLCTLGVSGGLPVSGQSGGVALSQAGDFAVIVISNAAPPNGPDVTGLFAITGTFQGAQVTPQFVMNPVQFYGTPLPGSLLPGQPLTLQTVGNSGNWQFLQNTVRNDTNAFIAGGFSPPNNSALQISLGAVAGLFAVRLQLNSITSGSLLVSGNTNPAGVPTLDALILQQVQALSAINKAQLLAFCDMNNTTSYAEAYGIVL